MGTGKKKKKKKKKKKGRVARFRWQEACGSPGRFALLICGVGDWLSCWLGSCGGVR